MRALLCLLIPALAAGAQNLPFNPPGTTKLFLPAKNAAALPTGTSSLPLQAAPTTLEFTFLGAQLSAFAPGSEFTSLSFRSAATTSWPASSADFSDYSITLARGTNAPGSLSPLISENSANAVTVRSGPLTIPANAFSPRPTPGSSAPFSFQLPFSSTYTHTGGNLHLLLSQSGASIPGQSIDAAATTDPDNNFLFQSRSAQGALATETTAPAATPITQLGVDPQIALPLVAATTFTGSTPFTGAFGQAPITIQLVIAADQIRFIPTGSLITSLSLRLAPNQSAWPAADTSTDSFQIQLSSSLSLPGSMSTNFPSNIATDALIVRDGPLEIPAGFFPATSSSSPRFSTPVHFQRGFVYKGGDLCIVLRHTPFSLASPALDTANTPSAARTIFVQDTSSADGTFLAPDASLAIRLGYTPSACVIPARATTSGGSGAFLFDIPRVHQMIVNESQVANIPLGSTLNGIAFRISPVGAAGYVSWPLIDSTLDQFDIDISTTLIDAIDMRETFSSNEGFNKVRVRSGPLFLPAQSFKVVGASVAEHSFFIPFTKPFVYSGGNICLTLRPGTLTGSTTVNLDGLFFPAGGNAKRAVGSSTATVGHAALSFAARFAFTPPPNTCPADLNNDGQVDDADFSLFIAAYDTLETPAADFNFDTLTDDADFSLFVVAYDALLCPEHEF